jgi:hypothetical protein
MKSAVWLNPPVGWHQAVRLQRLAELALDFVETSCVHNHTVTRWTARVSAV